MRCRRDEIQQFVLNRVISIIVTILLPWRNILRLRFPDVETNSGPLRPVPTVCRLLCSNVLGLVGNLSDLTVASSQYDILLCSETLVSDMRHVSEFWFPDLVALSCCAGEGCLARARGMAAYVRDKYGAFRQPKFECGCCEMLVFRVCGVRQNLYVYSLYRNPDLDDRIFYCLLTSMLLCRLRMVVPLSCFWVI